MAFTRWDPLRDLLALQEQLERLSGQEAAGWTPPVDLYETGGAFVLTAELPGLTREDIDIHAEETRIVIRGERAGHVPCEQYHRVERGHGRFSRAFSFGTPVDTSKVQASYAAGLLTVTVPKLHQSGERRIVIG